MNMIIDVKIYLKIKLIQFAGYKRENVFFHFSASSLIVGAEVCNQLTARFDFLFVLLDFQAIKAASC